MILDLIMVCKVTSYHEMSLFCCVLMQDSGSSRWKQSFSHASSSLGLGVGKGRGSFLHKKPPGSGGPNGQFVCRGADGKGGRTTVLKTASLLQTGMKVREHSQLLQAALSGSVFSTLPECFRQT